MAGLPEVARNMAVCLHLFATNMAVWRPFRDRWRRLGRFETVGGVWAVRARWRHFSPVEVFGLFECLEAVSARLEWSSKAVWAFSPFAGISRVGAVWNTLVFAFNFAFH